MKVHTEKIYVCIDGPRFGTKAESFFLKDIVKGDVVGMTNLPEAFLAREAQICYCSVGIATDYDCWHEDSKKQVDAMAAITQYRKSLEKVKSLLKELLKSSLPPADAICRESLKNAVLTKEEGLSEEKRALLELLRR